MVNRQVLASDRPGFPVLALPQLNATILGNLFILSGFSFLICKSGVISSGLMESQAVVVCSGCYNKVQQTSTTESILSHFGRQGV